MSGKEEFNILDCFEDNIGNIDITKNYIYVLKLVEDRYYVGRTGNIFKRIEEHFTNNGSIYTKAYKPVKVIEIEEEQTIDDERIKTLSLMEKYGWEKVRGAYWCSLVIKKPNIKKNKKRKQKNIVKIILHENDEKIKVLYCLENKSIIDIGNEINISPCLVAFRLEHLGIVERKQLARGYIEYIESDLYKDSIKRINTAREQNKCKNNEHTNVMNFNKENKKVNILNIKNIIREKYVKAIWS
jgi:predicted GIY-YIG superfamily endonuclease